MGFLLEDVQYAAANRDSATQNAGVMTPKIYDSYFEHVNTIILTLKSVNPALWPAYTKDTAPIKIRGNVANTELRYQDGAVNAIRYSYTSTDYTDRYISLAQPSYLSLYVLCKRIALIEGFIDKYGTSFNYWGTPQTDCPSALFCAGNGSGVMKPDYTLFNDIERRLNGIYALLYRSGTPGSPIPLWYYWPGTPSYPVMDIIKPESGWTIPTYE